MLNNSEIRNRAKTKSVKLWQVADCLGITDSSFSRKLRHELPEPEKSRILSIIDEISGKQTETAQ